MTEKRVVTGVTIQADSVVISGVDFDWLCSLAHDMERLKDELTACQLERDRFKRMLWPRDFSEPQTAPTNDGTT